MSEEDITKPNQPPEPNTKTTVGQVGDWVKNQDGKTNWVWGLIVSAVGLAVVAFMYWRSWKKGHELAQLKHARDVQEQEKRQTFVRIGVESNKATVDKLMGVVAERKAEIQAIDQAIEQVEKRREADVKEIAAIRNWRDFDRHMSGD